MDLPRPHEPIAVVQQRPSDIVNSRLEAAVGRYRRTERPPEYPHPDTRKRNSWGGTAWVPPRIPGKGTVGKAPLGYLPEYPEQEQLEKATRGLTVRMGYFRWLPRIPGWVPVVPATQPGKAHAPTYIYTLGPDSRPRIPQKAAPF
jgi:hypothetical protein